jgi:hypothetical protein
MMLHYKVKFKRYIYHSMQDLDAWCVDHVGARRDTWDRQVAHMDYEDHTYTWSYSFLTSEAATAFALTHMM